MEEGIASGSSQALNPRFGSMSKSTEKVEAMKKG